MRDYIILNGVNSNTITGLLISNLPPITKTKVRTQVEEIDGRDGDIVTTLGYSAYDKEFTIGLYGSFEIDDVIAYFNSEGTVTFSNEPDKYYNYQIIEQIDFEKLIRFKTAKVRMHVQPFKYPLEETPVEIAYQYVNNEAEEMDLDNTADAPMQLVPKGNTSQETTTYTGEIEQGSLVDGEPTTANDRIRTKDFFGVVPNTTIPITFSGVTDYMAVRYNSSKTFISNTNWASSGTSYSVPNDTYYLKLIFKGNGNITPSSISNLQVGNVPNHDYPQPIQVVSGDNSIEVCGKNLCSKVEKPSNSNLDFYINKTIQQTFTISFTINEALSSNSLYLTVDGTSLGNVGGISGSANTRVSKTIELSNANYQAIQNGTTVFLRLYKSGANFIIPTDAQIENGSSITTYQPYTGASYPISLGGQNRFDSSYRYNGGISSSGTTTEQNGIFSLTATTTDAYIWAVCGNGTTYSANIGYIMEVQEGETYYFKATNSNFDKNFITKYDSSKVSLGFTQNGNSFSYTIPSGVKYISYRIGISNATIGTTYTTSVIVTNDDRTPIELCKIGDYQDYIYKDSGKWYLKKEIGKVVLNGSESWTVNAGGTNTIAFSLTPSINAIATGSDNINAYVSHFKGNVNGFSADEECFWFNSSGYFRARINKTTASNVSNFQTWLSIHNTEVYYVLETPTTTEITDNDLIIQLEAINNARSYDTTTHITQNANKKPFILNATAIKKGTDTGVVDNIGNIYSKPTIDIEGSGTVEIYLENNQIFSVDLSNNSECVIDTTKLEAYDPSTSALMNRQVTGDYSNFKLNAGENNVKVSGNVTKATITNYTRWL